MHVCIVSKPKSEKNRKIEEKSFQGVSKTKKKKKKCMKRLSFITHKLSFYYRLPVLENWKNA